MFGLVFLWWPEKFSYHYPPLPGEFSISFSAFLTYSLQSFPNPPLLFFSYPSLYSSYHLAFFLLFCLPRLLYIVVFHSSTSLPLTPAAFFLFLPSLLTSSFPLMCCQHNIFLSPPHYYTFTFYLLCLYSFSSTPILHPPCSH